MNGWEKSENARVLGAWLDRHRARLYWQQTVVGVGTVSCYAIGAAVALVMRYGADRDQYEGWDIFVPATLDTSTEATLAAAETALGVGS